MRHPIRSTLLAFTGVCLIAGAAHAQAARSHVGPHLAYNFDAEEFGIGAQLSIPATRTLEFYPSFDIYFVDPGSLWALNADLKYRIPRSAGRASDFYVGGGLQIRHFGNNGNGDTNAGLNLLGGWESQRGEIHPFGEARLTLGDGSVFQIAGGLNITLGRH